MSIYSQMKKAGVRIEHRESDLYVPATEVSRRIVAEYPYKNQVKTFVSEGKTWFDIPFAYEPFFSKKNRASSVRSHRRSSGVSVRSYRRRFPRRSRK